MKNRMIAIALCLIMVSTIAATSAVVTAKPTTSSSKFVTYDVVGAYYGAKGPTHPIPIPTSVVGQLSVNMVSGQFNLKGKGTPSQGYVLAIGHYDAQQDVWSWLYFAASSQSVTLAQKSGTIHANGVLAPFELENLKTFTSGTEGSDWVIALIL